MEVGNSELIHIAPALHSIPFIVLNAQSLKSSIHEFCALLHCELRHTVICLCETWLDSTFTDALFGTAHVVFRIDRLGRQGGGSLVLVPSKYNVALVRDPVSNDNFEFISIDIHCRDRSVLRIISVYRNPSSRCSAALVDCLRHSIDAGVSAVAVGDFNLPHINWSTLTPTPSATPAERQLLDCVITNGLEQLVSHPTRNDNILDLVLCNRPGLVTNLSVSPPLIPSDHLMVQFEIDTQNPDQNSQLTSSYFDFRNADYTALNVHLAQTDWESILGSHATVEGMWIAFVSAVHEAFSISVPVKQRSSGSRAHHSPHVCHLIRRQKRLHSRYVSSGREADLALWKEANRVARLAIRQEVLEAELNVVNSGDDRQFWRFVSSRLRCKPKVPALKTDDGFAISSHSKADVLNQQFSSVFTTDNGTGLHLTPETQAELTVDEIAPLDLWRVLAALPNKFSSGPDGLPQYSLKRLAVPLAWPLAFICNFSLATSTVPSDWIKANVTPVFKKGIPSEPANYRPISITSCVSRSMEKFLKPIITKHLFVNGIISKAQHGFLSRHSTITQLIETLNDWTSALDNSQPVDVFYMDIAKAFDTVSHPKLFEKLVACGIRGRLLGWLKAWLTGRKQRVRVDDKYSEYATVTSGVPQGSVLGPLMFLIYINDLPKVIVHSKLKLFADDGKLYLCVGHVEQRENLQSDLVKVQAWCDTHQLQLAILKCSVLHLGPRTNPNHQYNLHGTNLESTTCIRDLGVLVSADLKFTEHCNAIAQSAAVKVGMILNCFMNRRPEFLTLMYKVFVRSRLEYASPVWNPSLKQNINTLESVQHRFTRRLPGLGSLSYPERLIATNLEPLELRRLQADLILVYKILHQHVSLNFDDYFQLARSVRTRGHIFKLEVPRHRTNYRKFFFSNRVVSVWNSLSADTVAATTLNCFQSRLLKENLSRFLQVRL